MPTSRHFRSRRTGLRPKTTWSQSAFEVTLGTVGALIFSDLTPVPLSIGDEKHGTATLLRSLMSFNVRQSALVSNTSQNFAVGMYVADLQAIAASQIVAPLGSGNQNQDWAYWTARSTFREDDVVGINWDVDLKSKRRLRAGYGLVMVFEPRVANTVSLFISIGMRQLWTITN